MAETKGALEMTPEEVAAFAKSYNLDQNIVLNVIQKEKSLSEPPAVCGHFVALSLFRGDKELLEAIKGNYLNVAIVAMLALTITIPLFINRGTFTTDPNILDIFEILMGLSSLFSVGAVLVPLCYCGNLAQLCPARSDVSFFLSLGTATDPEMLINLGVGFGFAGFVLAASQGFANPYNGYTLTAVGGFCLLVIVYRWLRTQLALVARVREKYFILNSGNVQKDWQIIVTDMLFGLTGQKVTTVETRSSVQPPSVSPPFVSGHSPSTQLGSDDRYFASNTQHDTAY